MSPYDEFGLFHNNTSSCDLPGHGHRVHRLTDNDILTSVAPDGVVIFEDVGHSIHGGTPLGTATLIEEPLTR